MIVFDMINKLNTKSPTPILRCLEEEVRNFLCDSHRG